MSHMVQSWTEQYYPKEMFAYLFKEPLGKHVIVLQMSLE